MFFSARLLSVLSLVVFCATGSAMTIASAQRRQSTSCTNPAVRQEWRTLSASVQAEYISAVQCLRTKPSQFTGVTANSTSLFDNFAEITYNLTPHIFNTAYFLPWHRYFLRLYEQALQECGYTGNLPYWDWTQDANNFAGSPLWENTAFGGNGASGTLCVTSGPFANLQVNIPTKHCLKRDFQKTAYPWDYPTTTAINELLNDTSYTYNQFREVMENTIAPAPEEIIGGDPGDISSLLDSTIYVSWAPNDPVYFPHYANVDRIWWLWQQTSTERATEYNGYRLPADADWPYDEQLAALTDPLPMFGGFASEVAVSEVMATEGELLCYTYQ